jgi:hypothetical protein
MKASRRRVRCGVVDAYCCQTWWAISAAEALVFRVAGPEESFGVRAGAGAEGVAEVVEAAWRLGAMILVLEGLEVLGRMKVMVVGNGEMVDVKSRGIFG